MRIHYFAFQDLSEPTGASTHVCGDVQGLRACGAHVDVMAVASGTAPAVGGGFHALPPFRNQPGFLAQAVALRRTMRCAVRHLRDVLPHRDVVLTRHYLAGDILRRADCRIPWVFQVNGLPAQERAARGGPTNRLVAARIEAHFRRTLGAAAHVVAVTPELCTTVQTRYGVPAGRTSVVPNGVDTALFAPSAEARAYWRARWGITDATPVVGYVGNCGLWQRFDVLVDALPELVRAVPGVRVVVVGDGAARVAWETLVARSGFADRVAFVGAVTLAESAGVFAALDVTVDLHHRGALTAQVGTAAVKVRAALATGVPVVAFAVPGIEFLQAESLGAVVPVEASALAGGIAAVLRDDGLRQEMGRRGRTYAERHFTWERIGAQLLDACRRAGCAD